MDGGDRTAVSGARCGLALLVLSSGCADVDATCEGGSPLETHPKAEHIQGPTLTGEAMLSAEHPTFSSAFDAVLDGLPEVWIGAEPLSDVTLSVKLEIAYADPQPAGAPVPPITAVLEGEGAPKGPSDRTATVTLPGPWTPWGDQPSVMPFVLCAYDSDEDCCPFGAPRCSGTSTLQLSRTSDPYPRVRVRYTVTTGANVYSCLEAESETTWTLEEVEP